MRRLGLMLALAFVAAIACEKENTVTTGDEVTVLDVGQQCSGADDLGCGEGAVCVLGYCRHGCTNDGECPQGALCIGDREPYGCTLPFELACSSSQPCEDPLVCGPDGKCRWACSEAADCPRNEHLCYEGACVSQVDPLNVGEECSEDDLATCGDGAVCLLGYCRQGCTTDAQCSQGALCIGAEEPFGCTLPEELECSEEDPCEEPLTCGIDGKCRWACAETADCPRNEHTCILGACLGDEPIRDEAVACAAGSPPFQTRCNWVSPYQQQVSCNVLQYGHADTLCDGTCVDLEYDQKNGPTMAACVPNMGKPYTVCWDKCLAEATACAWDYECSLCASSSSGCMDNALYTALAACAVTCPLLCSVVGGVLSCDAMP